VIAPDPLGGLSTSPIKAVPVSRHLRTRLSESGGFSGATYVSHLISHCLARLSTPLRPPGGFWPLKHTSVWGSHVCAESGDEIHSRLESSLPSFRTETSLPSFRTKTSLPSFRTKTSLESLRT